MMVAAVVLGTLCWLPILPMLTHTAGWEGLSLMDARSGVAMACLMLLVAGLAAMVSGLYVSSAGNPLSGVYTTGFSLMILAAYGGSMNGLIMRQAERSAGQPTGGALFRQLGVEMLLWALAWCLLMFLIRRFRDRIRERLVPRRLKTPFATTAPIEEEDTPRFVLQVRPAMAGLLCAGLAWVMCRFLMQTDAGAQVIGSILLAFMLAGLTARLAIPTGNVVFLLLSPLGVGLAAYVVASVNYGTVSAEELIQLWQRGTLAGPMYALPIHWASAGLIGVSIGIGMAQAIDRVRTEEQAERAASASDDEDKDAPEYTV